MDGFELPYFSFTEQCLHWFNVRPINSSPYLVKMSVITTPEQVGRSMTLYNFRPGPVREALPRERINGSVIHFFDKGHHRFIAPATLGLGVLTAGNTIYLRGKPYELGNYSIYTYPIPRGFVPVSEKTILQHYTTTYRTNIMKMERSLIRYYREYSQYMLERSQGVRSRRPRLPTLRALYLDSATEFESFIRPLCSFYCERLKQAFSRLVNVIGNIAPNRTAVQNYEVFVEMNNLFYPDNGNTRDDARIARWNEALTGGAHRYIGVNITNLEGPLDPVLDDPNAPLPPSIPPFPPGPPVPPVVPPPPPPPVLTPQDTLIEQDKAMLERVRMGRSQKWKKLFLYMTPWKKALLVENPFVSPEYRQAFNYAQQGFKARHDVFRTEMVRRRAVHATEWQAYTRYRDEMNSSSMLGKRNRTPVAPFAERPQVENLQGNGKNLHLG